MTNKIRKTAPTMVASLMLSTAAVAITNRETPRLPQFDRTAAADAQASRAFSPDTGPQESTPHELKRASLRFARQLELALAR